MSVLLIIPLSFSQLDITSLMDNDSDEIFKPAYYHDLERSDIVYGEPVTWLLKLYSRDDFTELKDQVLYQTPTLLKTDERFSIDDTVVEVISFTTDFTQGYENLSYSHPLSKNLFATDVPNYIVFSKNAKGEIKTELSGVFSDHLLSNIYFTNITVSNEYELFVVYKGETFNKSHFEKSLTVGNDVSSIARLYFSDVIELPLVPTGLDSKNLNGTTVDSIPFLQNTLQLFNDSVFTFDPTSRKNFFTPRQGEFIFEASTGDISYIYLDTEQKVVVRITNMTTNDLHLNINFPFSLDADIAYYLWGSKANNNKSTVPYLLDDTEQIMYLNLRDGGEFDEDAQVNGDLVFTITLPNDHSHLRIQKQLNAEKGSLIISYDEISIKPNKGKLSSLKYVQLDSIPSQKFSVTQMPYELAKFEITNLAIGEKINVTLTFPKVTSESRLVKYNSLKDEWYAIPFTRLNDTSVVITIIDGGFGDDDGVANGIIVDDIGLIIIPITEAYHVDATNTILADITDDVITQDDLWSDIITHDERIHVVFEENLTSINDVTIYAKGLPFGNDVVDVEVYEHYTQNYMGTFYDLDKESMHKIYLTNLQNPSAEFDLVIQSRSANYVSGVSFDLIIDPTAIPSGGDTLLAAQVCAAEDQAAKDTFNLACGGTYPAACGAGNDLLSCDDGNVESFLAKGGVFAGVRVETYNTSVTTCDAITSVSVCYEWWSDKTGLNNCDVEFDNDGDGSWVSVVPGCPGTTANPGIACINVTALDNDWTCNDFFGTGPTTYARIRSEVDKSSNAGGPATISWDALYFNVSFTEDTTPPSVTLQAPTNPAISNNTLVDFTYLATDSRLDTCTLYGNFSGSWAANETNASIISSVADTVSLTLPQGNFSWNVECTDEALNSAFATVNYSVVVDSVSPTVILNGPIPDTYTSDTTPYFSWFTVDTDPILSCGVYIDSILVQDGIETDFNAAYNSTTLSDGIHNWSVSCLDDAGNRGYSLNRSVIIDTASPAIVLDLPDDLAVFGNAPVEFNWTMTDSISPNATCDLYADGSINKTVISINNTQSSQTITGFSGGDHTWYVQCTDLAANVQTSATRTVTIDIVAPQVNLISPVNATLFNYTPLLFEYNVTDSATTISSCSLIVNGSSVDTDATIMEDTTQSFLYTPTENLNQNWTVSCTDTFSNVGTASPTRYFDTDLTLPVISNEDANGTAFAVNDYICLNVTVTDSSSGVSSVTAYVTTPASGSTPFTLTTGASCGNAGGNIYATEILLDELGSYNWTNTVAVDVAGNIRDEVVSPIKNWSTSSSFLLVTTMVEPIIAFEINESDSTIYDFRQGCSVSCDISSSGNCDDVMITAQYYTSFWKPTNTTVQDLNTTVDSYSCGNLTPGSSCAYNFTVATSTFSGGQVLPIRCGGTSSNAPSDFSSNISATINDHPVADFSIPLTNNTILNDTVTLNSNGTDDQGIATYTFEIDGFNTFASSTTICSGASNTCALDTVAQTQCADNSDCYIRQTLTDTDGLVDELIYKIEIDNTNPTVSLDLPTNNTVAGADVTFSYTPTDPYIDSCTLYGNFSGAWLANETNSSPATTVQDDISLSLATGLYVWNVQCSDDYTNTGFATQNYTLTVDATKPVVVLNTPTDNVILTTAAFDFTYTPSDTSLDVCNLYTDKTASWIIENTTISPNTGIINTFGTTKTDGTFNWNVQCNDTIGNTDFAFDNFTVTVDTTDPTTFTLVSPVNNTESKDRTPLLDWADTSDLTFVNYTIEVDTAANFASPDYTYVTTNSVTNSTFQVVSSWADNTRYFWRVIAYDNATHSTISTDTSEYITDNTAPVVNLIAPADLTVYSANSAMQFDLNVSDTNSIANCSVFLNGVEDVGDAIYNVQKDQTVSIFKTPIANGVYNWSVLCFDYAQNSFQTGNRTLTINVSYTRSIFYASATSNIQSPNVDLVEDGTFNSYAATCVKNSATTVTTATGQVGNNGFLIIGDQVAGYSSNVSLDRTMYTTWVGQYNDGGGFTSLSQDGDNSLGGTSVATGQSAVVGENSFTPAEDIYLSSTGSLRFSTNLFYNSGSGTTSCTQFYDTGDSYLELYGYELGFIDTTNQNETTLLLNEGDTANITCTVECTSGYCMATKASLELNTSSGWESVDFDTTDSVVLDIGEQNDIALGNINVSQNVSYIIKANKAGFEHTLRCSATSTYDNHTGIEYTYINITDTDIPIINTHNATPSVVNKFENITFYANVTDNVEVDTVTLELEGINYTMINLSADIFEYTINTSVLAGGTQNYTIYANDTTNNLAVIVSGEYTVQTLDLVISNITFANLIIVGNDTIIQVNVTNDETIPAVDVVLNLSISTYNGVYVFNESLNQTFTVPASSYYLANLTWNAKVGPIRVEGEIDSTDVIAELNETNNNLTVFMDVYSSETLYGSIANYQRVLFDSSNNGFTAWSLATPVGVSYYADTDASWLPFNLAVFNETNDFNESDTALGLTHFNDSIQKLYDANDDGVADQTRNVSLGGTYYTVPVTNSTNSSTFLTGILYDGADGTPYMAGQDLIFIAILNGSQVGLYGTYDYEVRIPYTLGLQTGAINSVERLDEID